MRSSDFSASLFLANEADTTRFGALVAPLLQPGDTVLLNGPIGAGKTHLARAIIQARLDTPEDVPSPTYTLVQTYDLGDVELWHTDLYRLTAPEEIEELGLADAFENAIVLIEWPERLGDRAPKDALTVRFEAEDDGRRLSLSSPSIHWAKLNTLLADV